MNGNTVRAVLCDASGFVVIIESGRQIFSLADVNEIMAPVSIGDCSFREDVNSPECLEVGFNGINLETI